jgi:hypothetical protein
MPKREVLYTNLLPVIEFPRSVCLAQTTYLRDEDFARDLRRLDPGACRIWMLKRRSVLAFCNMRQYPWDKLCDQGTVDTFTGAEWAMRTDLDEQRDFVRLLNLTLRFRLAHHGIEYHHKHDFYYVRDTDDLSERVFEYKSIKHRAQRVIFGAYWPQGSTEPAHYRHSAFVGRFVRYDTSWYLEITPTYHFTLDGRGGYRFAHNALSGLKRQEKNAAVMGQVVMWAEFLRQAFPPPDLTTFDDDTRLQFGDLVALPVERGIPDEAWLRAEAPEEAVAIQADLESMGLFGL